MYDSEGQLLRRLNASTHLEGLMHYGDGFLGKGQGNKLLTVDRNFKVVRSIAISRLGGLYQGWVVNGEEIVAYGAAGEREYKLGFVRVNMSSRSAELIHPFARNDFYLINHQYVAVSGGSSYFLALDEGGAIIYRVPRRGAAIRLKSMLANLTVPRLREKPTGPGGSSRRFEELESLRMPAGLYGHGGFLYLLVRDPVACSPWFLQKIDPINDRLAGDIVSIPSFARHIAIVPGDRNWLVVEKGAVESGGNQYIGNLQVIPARWITQPETSPLKDLAGRNKCLSAAYG